MTSEIKALLVGDNPFHGISHLSQERSRNRGDDPTSPEYAAHLISTALNSGANGFMFSVSSTTLSILNILKEKGIVENLDLYAVVPYAYEYVRLASISGGITGLAENLIRDKLFSRNFKTVISGLNGIAKAEPISLMKTYLLYEISRVKSFAGENSRLNCVLLHQLITDMCLGFNFDWVFRAYVNFMLSHKIKPGFNTGNFVFLVEKFKEWDISLEEVIIAAPFNKIGFQMVPSKEKCEEKLAEMPTPNVLAISIMAAGYLKPMEAIDHIASLHNIKGVAIGLSKEKHADETFRLLREKLP